jgi:hypothetical protein
MPTNGNSNVILGSYAPTRVGKIKNRKWYYLPFIKSVR